MDQGTEEASNATREKDNQLLPNSLMTRSVERTSTQQLLVPILEKNDHTSAKLWGRKFVQYIKLIRKIHISKLANSKEILSQYRHQLDEETKFFHLC